MWGGTKMNLTVISVSSSQTGEAQKAVLRRTQLKKNPTATQTLPFLIWSSIHFFLFPLPVTGMVNLAGKRNRATALPSAENVWSPTWEVQGFGLPWLNGDSDGYHREWGKPTGVGSGLKPSHVEWGWGCWEHHIIPHLLAMGSAAGPRTG